TARAEATRNTLLSAGVAGSRIVRIEGVADGEPLIADNLSDPRNRRISITMEK
ncbi:MAG: flagellar motor protein MotB, partial [Sphingopyxis sp.]